MSKIITAFFLLLFLTACSNSSTSMVGVKCNENNSQNCNKTCEKNSDCKQACPIGCINKNQDYQAPSGEGSIQCTRYLCECYDNQCRPKQ